MARKKVVEPAVEFPKDTCGSCKYYEARMTEDSLCWGFPPMPAGELVVRELPVHAEDRACAFHKLKEH